MGDAALDGRLQSEPMVGRELTHVELLRNVEREGRARGLHELFIVDVDFHHAEPQVWDEIITHVPNEVIRHALQTGNHGGWYVPGAIETGGVQELQGRIQSPSAWHHAHPELAGADRDVARIRDMMDAMGSDYASLFPSFLLNLGLFPFREFEAPIAFAWAEWVSERVLAQDSRIITMLSLPFGDPDACLKLVEHFGDTPGVVGFMITSVRYDPTYKKEYMKLYRALEERGLPLGFHSSFNYMDRHTQQFNKFISVHALGFPTYNMVQATNWIVNGLPERFPDLNLLFIEGGLAWIPFLMQRLDAEFMMRRSEAPLLKRRPSEYMKEFYYSSQPLESVHLKQLEHTFEMINAETQLCWASDWPHWDWDPPHHIWDLPFLTDQARRNILGENARRLFNLPADFRDADVQRDGSEREARSR
jgi:uncharacterized protein